jgi:peptide/nickel transport system substrate-binding protein
MAPLASRSVSILGALLLLIGLVPAAAQDKPRLGGELVFVVPAEPPSFDAHREETFAMLHPGAPHYNTLLRVDPNDRTGTKFIGDLAESWTASPDKRTYTFKIRQGVKFHDGSLLTARDVKRLYDEEVHYIHTFQWQRIVPHLAKVRGWTITPSHYLNQQLDTVWLSE